MTEKEFRDEVKRTSSRIIDDISRLSPVASKTGRESEEVFFDFLSNTAVGLLCVAIFGVMEGEGDLGKYCESIISRSVESASRLRDKVEGSD